jgi:integrase
MDPIFVTLPPLPAWPEPTILTGHLAPTSLAKYHQAVHAYRTFCGTDARALDATSLARWRTHLVHDTRLHPHTINHRLAAVKRLIAEAAAQGYVDVATADACARVRPLKPQTLPDRGRRLTRTRLLPAEMRRLCEAPNPHTLRGLRDRALLATLASSGCRVSEVVALTTAQIHARAAVFTSFAGRGGRLTATPLSTTAMRQLVQHYAAAAGLPPVTPHDFRRFVGTELARRDIRLAQKALGHTRIETTARHYVLDELTGGLTDAGLAHHEQKTFANQ